MNKELSLRKKIGLELFRKMRKNHVKLHELQTIFWECTLRCNLACKHCGSDCRAITDTPDMPIADFLKVIDRIKPEVDSHKVMIIFSGGEPLMRKDLEQCGMELYRREFTWGLVTNGMLLNRQRLQSLLAAGMRSITVSLDGFEYAHNWLRQNTQSYSKALNAVRMLSGENDLVWDAVTCANKKNLPQLSEFKDFLIENGVKNWRIFTISSSGRANNLPELQLSDEEFTALLNFIRDTRKERRIHLEYGCEGFLGNYETEVRDSFFRCAAGVNVASVLADGSISACTGIRSNFKQGNIYNDDFWAVWNSGFKPYRDREWARRGICADCAMFRYCQGNGMHLHDDDGNLLLCHYNRIIDSKNDFSTVAKKKFSENETKRNYFRIIIIIFLIFILF
jgi:radical SAM enzyme (rSAM/lipoprotein system)